MIYNNVYIEAFGYELPPIILTSDDIENRLKPVYDRLKLPFGRLELMSGIKERRLWNNDTMPSDGSVLAGKKAIENSNIDIKDIGCLIHCSVSRDYLEPATASIVHNKLGLNDNTMVFDVSNACLGFLNSMFIIGNMIETGQIKAGLIVASEKCNALYDGTFKQLLNDHTITRKSIKKYFASLTIGSGAVACVLTHKSITKTNHKLLGGSVLSDTKGNDLCTSTVDMGFSDNKEIVMETGSEELMHRGCNLAKRNFELFKNELNINKDDFNIFFTHQVGIAHKKLLFELLNLPLEKDFATLEYLGNIGSVSLPITFAIGVNENRVKSGDKIGLLGIGSGINCIMAGVEW